MKNRSHKSTRQATDNCFKARNCRNCRNRQSCRYHPGKKVANHQSSQRGHSGHSGNEARGAGPGQNELQFAHNQNMGTCLDPSLPFQQPRSTETFCCQLLKLRVRDHLMKNRSHKSTRQATDNCFKARNCRNCRNRQSCRYHPGKKVANHQSSQGGHSAIVSWLRAKAVHADA